MQRGISNSITGAAGYPSSGETQANQGTLPAQRQQAPFAHQRNQGGLGQAVAGQQFRVNAQPMSNGVASYVGIVKPPPGAASLGSFQAPKPQLPGMQGAQPSYAAGGAGLPSAPQPQQQAPATPAPQPQQPPVVFKSPAEMGGFDQAQAALSSGSWHGHQGGQFTPEQQGQWTNAATPAPQEPAFRPDQTIYQTAHNYDIGGAYDVAARKQLGAQQEAAMRAQMAQSQLSGRGSDVAMLNAGYNNQLSQAAYEQQRSQLQAQGMKDAFGMNLQQAQALANTKMQLASIASQLGYNLSEQDMNQLGAEVVQKYGANATPGDFAASLADHAKAQQGAGEYQTTEAQMQKAMGYGIGDADLVGLSSVMLPASPQTLAYILKMHPDWVGKIKSIVNANIGKTGWGDGDAGAMAKSLQHALQAAGYW